MPNQLPGGSPAQQVVKVFEDDRALLGRLKTSKDPLSVIQEAVDTVEASVWRRDRWLYRLAVGVLGTLALIAAVGSIVLVAFGKTTPEVLVSLGSAAVGALVGLFAPSPTSKAE
jgi:hypothetical protein